MTTIFGISQKLQYLLKNFKYGSSYTKFCSSLLQMETNNYTETPLLQKLRRFIQNALKIRCLPIMGRSLPMEKLLQKLKHYFDTKSITLKHLTKYFSSLGLFNDYIMLKIVNDWFQYETQH